MRFKIFLIVFCSVCSSSCSYSQDNNVAIDTFIQTYTPSLPYKDAHIHIAGYFQLLKDDFVQQATAPFQVRGNDLLKTGGFALVTAGVMKYDRSVNDFAMKLHEKSSAVRSVSPVITKFGGRYALFTMLGIGSWSYLTKNPKLTNATLLATQSYLTSGIWIGILKFVSGRERPSYHDPLTNENKGSWHGMFFQFKKDKLGNKPDGEQYSSFPSGHAGAAFSIATVYAQMYKDRPGIPVIAYTSATLIALSRMTLSRHWASDVLVSSALGYLCGQQVVKNFNKSERLNSVKRKKKNALTYNINFSENTFTTELTYTFR